MYFDQNNNYFDDYKVKDNSLNIDIDNIYFNRNNTLHDYEEGFNKGNMFKNIYSKYKNHVYKLKVSNKKDELLYKIQVYTFVIKDLNLYLDVFPNNKEILNEFLKANESLKNIKKEYEKLYGPLCINSVNDKFTWISNPWPWDKGGKNV